MIEAGSQPNSGTAARELFPMRCPKCAAELSGEQPHCDGCGYTYLKKQAPAEPDDETAPPRFSRFWVRMGRMAAWVFAGLAGIGALFLLIPMLIVGLPRHLPDLPLWEWGLFIGGILAILYALSALPMSTWFPDKRSNSSQLDALLDPLAGAGQDAEYEAEPNVKAIDILSFILGILMLLLALRSL
jgi:MFS family permease